MREKKEREKRSKTVTMAIAMAWQMNGTSHYRLTKVGQIHALSLRLNHSLLDEQINGDCDGDRIKVQSKCQKEI